MYTLRDMLTSGTSMNRAVQMLHSGLIDQRTFDRYCFLDDWCAPRFSGSAGFKQERFWTRFGADACYRRHDRVKALHDRIRDGVALCR